MSADFIHEGHINIINEASKYGEVIIGLLTDEAIASYKRVPVSNYHSRKKVVEGIRNVSKVVPQCTLDYTDNLNKYKPDYVVHGDDWKEGVQYQVRKKVLDIISKWNGKLIEVPYTTGISSTKLIEDQLKNGVTPEYRRKKLKKLLELKPYVRVIEAHNGLSAIVAEDSKLLIDGEVREFDAIWISSLTDSTSKGKPDIEIVDFTSRCNTINEILEVTSKPLIVDGDTGGDVSHFKYMVRTLERLGVSAIIIEDKKFPKQNSLLENTNHIQEDVDIFCNKIKEGVQSRVTQGFMIIARIESFISKPYIDVKDALHRAKSYINSGADAIMIHTKRNNPEDIIEFSKYYSKWNNKVPLVMVPTTYNQYTEKELCSLGANIIIYANHLLRASYKNMKDVAEQILINQRSYEISNKCSSINETVKLCQK